MVLWKVSELYEILYLLKLLFTFLHLEVFLYFTLSFGFQKTGVFLIMAQILIVFNSKLATNHLVLFDLILVIFFGSVGDIESFG
jgi:hypothetical protein